MERINAFLRRGPRVLYWSIIAAGVGFLLWSIALYYIPGKGFTYLINFGLEPSTRYIRELRPLDIYLDEDSWGYDGQYYAQIALKPLPMSRDLRTAVDNLAYRSRRILFCWTAYLLGLGQPNLIVQVFALQNVAVWLILAWLLLRWFPPPSLNNAMRWAGTMFAFGLINSVRSALLDGPSLLMIAWSVALLESGRCWSSACVLGVSGLGRETNLLAALLHGPDRDWGWRGLTRAAGRGFIIITPLALWIVYLWHVFGEPSNAGVQNIAAPLEGYLQKWSDWAQRWQATGGDAVGRWTLLILVSLTVQLLALLLRPQWNQPWWRVGAAYAVLMVFLGEAVWQGYPGAAARVLLPMTLAFNVVVPRGRWWWPVLLLGNLSALGSLDLLKPSGAESFLLEGPRNVWMTPAHEFIGVEFPSSYWYSPEKSHLEYWRWSRGPAEIVVHNPQPFPVEVHLAFDLRAFDERTVRVLQGKSLRWEGRVDRNGTSVVVAPARLEPGDNRWRFETDKPAIMPEGDNLRSVAFNLRNLVIRAVRRLEPQAPPGAPAHP